MTVAEDEMKIHRLVVNAISRHAGARVLTIAALADLSGLNESKVRWSIGVLRRAGFFTRQTHLVWETRSSVLKLRRGVVLESDDARTLLKKVRRQSDSCML